MQSMIRHSARFLVTSAYFVLFLATGNAEDMHKSAGAESKEILKANETVVGGALRYPQTDKPEITSLIVTIQPGGHSNLHQHPVVTFVHVLEGEAELHVGEKTLHYEAGDTWIEPIDTLNQVFNPGTVPLKNLVVFVGAEGQPNSIAAQ